MYDVGLVLCDKEMGNTERVQQTQGTDLSCSERGLPVPGGIRESVARMASTRSPLPFRACAQ